MAAVLLRRFSKPSMLRSIEPLRLRAFLAPYRDYLEDRGFAFPNDDKFDYESLADILLSPDEITPPHMVESICIVDEMATPQMMDDLLEGNSPGDDVDLAPIDVAIDIFLNDPDFLHRKHRERCIERLRSYVILESSIVKVPWGDRPDERRVAALELALGEWFARRRRTRDVKVLVYPNPAEVWFLVRHGEPFKRDESLEGRTPGTVCYRPVRYDVVVFDRQTHELRMSGRRGPQHKLYRLHFGANLFDDPDGFHEMPRYTLDPLREDEEACLVCHDVEGLEWARLREIEVMARFVPPPEELIAWFRSRGLEPKELISPESEYQSWRRLLERASADAPCFKEGSDR